MSAWPIFGHPGACFQGRGCVCGKSETDLGSEPFGQDATQRGIPSFGSMAERDRLAGRLDVMADAIPKLNDDAVYDASDLHTAADLLRDPDLGASVETDPHLYRCASCRELYAKAFEAIDCCGTGALVTSEAE